MEVITFVKGNIPPSKREEFELSYEVLKKNKKPDGLIASYLLEDNKEEGLYLIETVWASQEALDKMRSEGKPAAIELFNKVGVEPTLKVYNMKNNI